MPPKTAILTLAAVAVCLGCGGSPDDEAPSGAEAWEAAIAAIAASDRYDGLQIVPQAGLVPLGADRRSGLWEFWHPASGARPERGEDGNLRVTGETGLTFVLIPGGTFTMGSQKDDPAAPLYDPLAKEDETPHRVTLAPYFVSKYEMTQGQWARVTGLRPSLFAAGDRGGDDHPVERVTWIDCAKALKKAGLVLPTEAQWEHAARGGTTTPWWPGEDVGAIGELGAANVLDETARENPNTHDWDVHEGWTDGYVVHAPVGSFAPNPFGLHDVIGNVWEWCRDPYGSYELPTAEGDGRRLVQGQKNRAFRGGSYRFGRDYCRSAGRQGIEPLHQGAPLGVRPARALEGADG